MFAFVKSLSSKNLRPFACLSVCMFSSSNFPNRAQQLATMPSTPKSCDTFVALPPATANGYIVFGKNSDRPCGEVQEVVTFPAADHEPDSKIECTYVAIQQAAHTHAVVLSRPSWMWGAEMGANEHGVCIGNEAVFTKEPDNPEDCLLGMDFVRLGLERGKTAKEALDVMINLLEEHGQGGNCSESPHGTWTYHNSFIIADRTEAWVFETAGKAWAAERITSGVRNISNNLTIGTKIDKMSTGIKEEAIKKHYWAGDGDFHFTETFAIDPDPDSRQIAGHRMLENFSKGGGFSMQHMAQILRDENSGICMSGGFSSTGSQISVLSPPGSPVPACHWFTATSNPTQSCYKPFFFGSDQISCPETMSPDFGDNDPRKLTPRFVKQVDRRHPLWKAHERTWHKFGKNHSLKYALRDLEKGLVEKVEGFANKLSAGVTLDSEMLTNLFCDAVKQELECYNK